MSNDACPFLKNNRKCVLKVEAISETSHFSIKNAFCFRTGVSNQRPLYGQPVAQPAELSWFNVDLYTFEMFVIKYMSYFQSLMDLQPL